MTEDNNQTDDYVQVDLAGDVIGASRDRFEKPDPELRVMDAPIGALDEWGLDPEWLGKSLTELDDVQQYAQPYRMQVLFGYVYVAGSGENKSYGGVQFRTHIETIGEPPQRMREALEAAALRLQTIFDSGVYDDYMTGFNFADGWKNVEVQPIGGDEVHRLGIPQFEVEVYTAGKRELGGEALGDLDPWIVNEISARSIDWTATLDALEQAYGSQQALADSLGVHPSTISSWKTRRSWGSDIRNSEHYDRVYGRAKRRNLLVYDKSKARTDWYSTIERLEDKLGTQKELADALGVSPRTIRGWKQYLRGETDGSRARDPRGSEHMTSLRSLADREDARVYVDSAEVVEIADEHLIHVDRDRSVGGHGFLGFFDAPPRITKRESHETEFEYDPQRRGF